MTFDTTLTLSGTAVAGETVELLDGAIPKGTASVDAAGQWNLSVSDLDVGRHDFMVRGRYGSQPESSVWTVRVMQP